MATPLEELHKQQSIIKDRIRSVVHREGNGVYLHGRPGSSKTRLVRTTLETLAAPYAYSLGHVTPIGLFELISTHRDQIILLDDVSSLFKQPVALQLLLAALGNPHDDSRTRVVRYKTAKGDISVPFTGGIIAISNLPLSGHNPEVVAALNDRVYVVSYEPTDEQICAHIMDIAEKGPRGVSPEKAKMVANFVLKESRKLEMRPSLRTFVDKAIPDFRLWENKQCETHWKDLVLSSLKQEIVLPQREQRDLSRAERNDTERRIALGIYREHDNRTDRLTEWKSQTGKSQAAFYRRIEELKQEGKLGDEL
jgi:hypothetical protein